MKRVFLIGYMGAGKTTVGRSLANRLGLSFIDLDHFIETRYNKSIRQMFQEEGEAEFRKREKQMLHEVSEFEDVVISTGGGVPCYEDNMQFMNKMGKTIYLKASVKELTNRLEACKGTRPVLAGRSGEELHTFIEETLSKRQFYYEQAAIIYDAEIMLTESDVDTISKALQELI